MAQHRIFPVLRDCFSTESKTLDQGTSVAMYGVKPFFWRRVLGAGLTFVIYPFDGGKAWLGVLRIWGFGGEDTRQCFCTWMFRGECMMLLFSSILAIPQVSFPLPGSLGHIWIQVGLDNKEKDGIRTGNLE